MTSETAVLEPRTEPRSHGPDRADSQRADSQPPRSVPSEHRRRHARAADRRTVLVVSARADLERVRRQLSGLFATWSARPETGGGFDPLAGVFVRDEVGDVADLDLPPEWRPQGEPAARRSVGISGLWELHWLEAPPEAEGRAPGSFLPVATSTSASPVRDAHAPLWLQDPTTGRLEPAGGVA